MTLQIIHRPDLARTEHRLKCIIVVPNGEPHQRVWENPVTRTTAERWVRMMELQGWQFTGRYESLAGPSPVFDTSRGAAKVYPRPRYRPGEPHRNNEAIERLALNHVVDIPTLETADAWQYILTGVFVRPYFLVEREVADAAG